LVDDEEMVRELARTVLSESGYTALLAADGKEALEVYLKERDRIDLIVLDLSMPRVSGQEFLEQLQRAAPEAKVIVSSGYGEDGYTQALQKPVVVGSIAKPYRPDNLTRKIRETLDLIGPAG
ncbi:MAG: response regulator, partial [bacterium]